MEFLFLSFFILTISIFFLFKLYFDKYKEANELKKRTKCSDLLKNEEQKNKNNKIEFFLMEFLMFVIMGTFLLFLYVDSHFNAIRQASRYGDCVIALDDQKDIENYKGSTIYTYEERKIIMSSLRFVKDVIDNMPYVPDNHYIDYLLNDECIDYIIHGDDPCYDSNGQDVYSEFKRRGVMKIVKRTEGISTTNLLGRILLTLDDRYDVKRNTPLKEIKMLPTLWRYIEFSGGDKIVLITGSFDVLHPGHIEALKVAKSMGDFLYVGIHDDETVSEKMGAGYPIMNIHERSLSLLAIKYVDDVIMGCPFVITKDLINSLHINLVVRGTTSEKVKPECVNDPKYTDEFKVPQEMGIYKEFKSPSNFTVHTIIERISNHKEKYIQKYEKKLEGEINYYSQDDHVDEV